MRRPRSRAVLALALPAALLATACSSGGSSQPAVPTVAPAQTFRLAHVVPSAAASPRGTTTVGFTILQPSGAPLTRFRSGPGPHTGVHVILVRDDLSLIIHRHPHPAANGRVELPVRFTSPGRYRMLVDVYPDLPGAGLRNFQLHSDLVVAGKEHARPLPGFSPTATVAGYRFHVVGRPQIAALQPSFMTITVRAPDGSPARFSPWYGALAHAIFFRKGTLDYFHTHVCAPGAGGCASLVGGGRLTGRATPGRLRIGLLLPAPGVWRLFLQTRSGRRVLTAPFTLTAR
jgi:hypothetical protein